MYEDSAGNVTMDNTPPGGNNVWDSVVDTVSRSVGQVSQIYRDISLAKYNAQKQNTQSTAAPNGRIGMYIGNPLPGMFGTNPQAETKVAPGSNQGFNITPMIMIVALVVVAGLFLRR